MNLYKNKRKVALMLLAVWGVNLFTPFLSYALTSGPAQPETQGFQVTRPEKG